MNLKEVVELMDLRFKSGNSIPADRAHIKVEEWEILREALIPKIPTFHERDDMVQHTEEMKKYYGVKNET